MQRIYFDNAATTALSSEALQGEPSKLQCPCLRPWESENVRQ